MSTRKLIVVALLAGLAILLAGGIQLVLLAGRDDDGDGGETRDLSALGTAVVVDGRTVTPYAVRRVGDVLVLEVGLAPGPDDTAGRSELARGWALFAPDASLVPRGDVPAGGAPCAPSATSGTSGTVTGTPAELLCDVAFTVGSAPRSGTYLVSYRGAQSWAVPLPAT